MNLVGAGGKGESVWLAFFLIAVLKRYAPLARARADAAFAARVRERSAGACRAHRSRRVGRRLVPPRLVRRRHAARLGSATPSAGSTRSRRAGRCSRARRRPSAPGARWTPSMRISCTPTPASCSCSIRRSTRRGRLRATSRATFPACARTAANTRTPRSGRRWRSRPSTTPNVRGSCSRCWHRCGMARTPRRSPPTRWNRMSSPPMSTPSRRMPGAAAGPGTRARQAGCSGSCSSRCSASSGAGTDCACDRSYRRTGRASRCNTVTDARSIESAAAPSRRPRPSRPRSTAQPLPAAGSPWSTTARAMPSTSTHGAGSDARTHDARTPESENPCSSE